MATYRVTSRPAIRQQAVAVLAGKLLDGDGKHSTHSRVLMDCVDMRLRFVGQPARDMIDTLLKGSGVKLAWVEEARPKRRGN